MHFAVSAKLSLAAHITLQALIVSFVCTPVPFGLLSPFRFFSLSEQTVDCDMTIVPEQLLLQHRDDDREKMVHCHDCTRLVASPCTRLVASPCAMMCGSSSRNWCSVTNTP
jgi:hypothetical protein